MDRLARRSIDSDSHHTDALVKRSIRLGIDCRTLVAKEILQSLLDRQVGLFAVAGDRVPNQPFHFGVEEFAERKQVDGNDVLRLLEVAVVAGNDGPAGQAAGHQVGLGFSGQDEFLEYRPCLVNSQASQVVHRQAVLGPVDEQCLVGIAVDDRLPGFGAVDHHGVKELFFDGVFLTHLALT